MEIGTARYVSFMLVADHNNTCMHISLQPENIGGNQNSRSDSTNGLKVAKHHIMLSIVFSSSNWCTEASPIIIALLISELDFSVDRSHHSANWLLSPIFLHHQSHASIQTFIVLLRSPCKSRFSIGLSSFCAPLPNLYGCCRWEEISEATCKHS